MKHANTNVLIALGLLAACGDNSSGPSDGPDQPTIDSRPSIDAPDDDPDAPVQPRGGSIACRSRTSRA